MSHRSQTTRAAVVVSALAVAACGASGDAADGGESTPTTLIATTTTSLESRADDEPVELTPSINTLTPGVTYRTNTDVSFSFSVVESEAAWWPVVTEDWSVSMVFANLVGGELNGPQLSLGVAEPGATRESVVAAMNASAAPISYEASEGLFGGRDSIILDGSIEDETVPRPSRILTGEASRIEVILESGRSYRSHVFEEGGRVFIITVEASSGDIPLVLAEAGPIFDSLQIGVSE